MWMGERVRASSPSPHLSLSLRQELELALSVKPDSLETRLYQFALRGERVCETETITRLPGHPIHQLAAMEKNLVESADPQALARTYRRKRRQLVTSQAQPQGVSSYCCVEILK
ncbi:hypothetical protein J6590_100993 [Homalodisca vitripennis]|nr:hypothetical protein J6590_100993 [Homalodisca vitripennis]